MRKLVALVAGSVAVAGLLSAVPALAGLQRPPYGWTFTFDQAQRIDAGTQVTGDSEIANVPVRTPLGSTVGYFVRVEMREGAAPMGVVTLNETNRTVSVPLDRLRFNPARREVLTDLSFMQIHLMPSGALDHPYQRLTGNLTR